MHLKKIQRINGHLASIPAADSLHFPLITTSRTTLSFDIFYVTGGYPGNRQQTPVLATTFTLPPHASQVSMSILNTRRNRCAQLITARR